MPPPIDVQPETFEAASQIFGKELAGDLWLNRSTLAGGLGDTAEMAGSDAAGTSWAGSYDPAAQATAGAIEDLANACSQLGSMLQLTGFNHGLAESQSDPTRSVPTPADTATYTVGGPACYMPPPSAAGGSGDTPTGWGLIEHLVGYLWPNGDQDKLRSAATAWSNAATGVYGLQALIPDALAAISSQKSPEIADATTTVNGMNDHITDVADSCQAISKACSDFAGYIDSAHSDIEHELISLVEWTAGIEAGGALLGLVTFGGGEAVAQGVEAARIARTATRVGSIIAHLIELAGTVTRAVGTVVSKIAEVCRNLRTILGARLSVATTRLVARLPEALRTTEAAAEDGLAQSAESMTARQAMYDRYVAAKKAKGLTPRSFEDWEKAVSRWATNKAQGDAYRDAVAKDLGIEPGAGGWQKEVYFRSSTGKRFFDLANEDTKTAYEVKSGATKTEDAFAQMTKDEEAVRRGWNITWVLKTKLSPQAMARLQELATKYPGRFSYTTGP